jgi:uncharacterized membrane protein SirB2
MTTFEMLRATHVGAVVLTGALFVLRGAWMLRSPERLDRRWVRISPHVVDTVLLASAIAMLWVAGWSPTQPWIATKIVALLVYIALGTIALKRGRTRGVRAGAFVAALATFAYIVSVALTKSPVGPLRALAG